jgi:uncharacterized OsmC-like protein
MNEETEDTDKIVDELRAKTLWEGGQRTNNIIRGFEIQTDEPWTEFGTNTAPAPAEVFLSAIGACLTASYAWTAFTSRLNLLAISANLRGIIKKVDGVNKITKVEVSLKVNSKSNKPDKLKRCYELALEKCLLLNTLECEKVVNFEYKIQDE